jgi:predicted N-acetyltransferase YhbS
MEIKAIRPGDDLWQKTIEYALECSWKAGPFLAKAMKENKFSDWERVFVVVTEERVIGFCTMTKTDCIPDVSYYPFIGFVFVDENYRGNRISEKLINFVINYAKKLDFRNIYLVSNQVNLYEKYGFVKINEKNDFWGTKQNIYINEI